MSKAKKYSCIYCGEPFEVYPPDDAHPISSRDRPIETEVEGEIIEMTFDCRNPECLKPNTLYWYRPKMSISVG